MVSIIPANENANKGGNFGRAFGQAFSQGAQSYSTAKENSRKLAGHQTDSEDYARRTGMRLSDNPDIAKIQISEELKGQNQRELAGMKSNEKKGAKSIAGLQGALQTVKDMRGLREKGNLGRGSSFRGFFGGETAKDIGTYEQLGKSLIQYASTIPIRNKLEFETLSSKLYDSTTTDSEAEGVLDAMEKIINDSLSELTDQPTNSAEQQSGFDPLSNGGKQSLGDIWK